MLYYNGGVYLPEQRFIRNYVPFYNSLGGEKKPLVFRGENRKRFLEEVLPNLLEYHHNLIPSLKDRFLN